MITNRSRSAAAPSGSQVQGEPRRQGLLRAARSPGIRPWNHPAIRRTPMTISPIGPHDTWLG
jgi:hypothetical protein